MTGANRQLVVMLNNQQKQEQDGSFSDIERRDNAVVKSFCDQSGIRVFDPLPILTPSAGGKPIVRQGNDE
jgi:hypothetical protein